MVVSHGECKVTRKSKIEIEASSQLNRKMSIGLAKEKRRQIKEVPFYLYLSAIFSSYKYKRQFSFKSRGQRGGTKPDLTICQQMGTRVDLSK